MRAVADDDRSLEHEGHGAQAEVERLRLSFGDGGFYTNNDGSSPNDISVDADGKIAIVGSYNGPAIWRLNSDGSEDNTFARVTRPLDSSLNFIGYASAVTVEPDGDVLITTLGVGELRIAAPDDLMPKASEFAGAKRFDDIDKAIAGADVIMALRIQRERQGANYFPSIEEYSKLFGLDRAAVEKAKPDVVILHPGPMNRGVEISSEVADGPYSVILDQVTNGVAVRMALLYLLAARGRADGEREPEEKAAS